jgi:hypothetical protein
VFIPRFVSVIADIAKYVGNSYEKLKWVTRWEEREEVFNLCHKTLEEMVSIIIKSGQGIPYKLVEGKWRRPNLHLYSRTRKALHR